MTGVPVCATCGADAVAFDRAGEPLFPKTCYHAAEIAPEQAHPRYRDATALGLRSLVVTLDEAQQADVRKVAERVAAKYKSGRGASMKFAPTGGRTIDSVNLNGFGGELAVSLWTGERWHRGDRKKPDVGDDIEVRARGYQHAALPLYDTYDKRDRRYVLAIGALPTYRLVGWIFGREGLNMEHAHPAGAQIGALTLRVATYLVDQAELHPMSEFTRAVSEAPEAR